MSYQVGRFPVGPSLIATLVKRWEFLRLLSAGKYPFFWGFHKTTCSLWSTHMHIMHMWNASLQSTVSMEGQFQRASTIPKVWAAESQCLSASTPLGLCHYELTKRAIPRWGIHTENLLSTSARLHFAHNIDRYYITQHTTQLSRSYIGRKTFKGISGYGTAANVSGILRQDSMAPARPIRGVEDS